MPATIGYPVAIEASDSDLLTKARERLEKGRTFRQSQREQTWRRNEDQYVGNHWGGGVANGDLTSDLITVNVSFSTVNTIMPYITGQDPTFLVSPYSQDATVVRARIQQAVLNRIWRAQRTGAESATRKSVSDFLIYGDGYLKIRYELVDTPSGSSPDAVTTEARIFVEHVSPWDVWVDPTADGIENARWVCQRILTTKRELEKAKYVDEEGLEQPMYRGLDEIAAGGLDIAEDGYDLRVESTATSADDYVIVYEYYDLIDQFMLSFTSNGDLPMRKITGIERPPLVQLGNYFLPRSPYHMGELEMIWEIQVELNKSRSQLITHRRRNILKYLVREGAIGVDQKAALQSPIVGEIVNVKGDEPLENIIKAVNTQPLMPEAYNSADQAMRDIYEITGVNEYLRGATPEIRRTATEASIIEGASNVKTAAKLRAVEAATRQAGEFILAIAKDVFPLTSADETGFFITGDEAMRVNRAVASEEVERLMQSGDTAGAQQVGMESQFQTEAIVSPTEDIFVGIYEVNVETGSTELRNPIFKEQKAREMAIALVQIAPTVAQLGAPINIRKALEIWFEAAGIGDIEGMFSGTATPPAPQAPSPGGPGGPPPQPNLAAAQPPQAPVTPDTSGAYPPA